MYTLNNCVKIFSPVKIGYSYVKRNANGKFKFAYLKTANPFITPDKKYTITQSLKTVLIIIILLSILCVQTKTK